MDGEKIMNDSKKTPKPSISERMKRFQEGRGPRVVIILSVLLFIISVLALIGYFVFFSRDSGSSRPLVLIHAPVNGEDLEIGENFLVHASARDDQGITRIEFWVDGSLEDVDTSNLEDGLNPFPFLVTWSPDGEGEHTLTFRAFNSRGLRSYTSVIVNGVWGEDRDGDGVDDALDMCPEIVAAKK